MQAGNKGHLQPVQELLMGTADMAASMTAFTAALEASSAFVMCCQGQVRPSSIMSISGGTLLRPSLISVRLLRLKPLPAHVVAVAQPTFLSAMKL